MRFWNYDWKLKNNAVGQDVYWRGFAEFTYEDGTTEVIYSDIISCHR